MLDQLDAWVDDIPLDTGVQRFGNKAFRKWGDRLEKVSQICYSLWSAVPALNLADGPS